MGKVIKAELYKLKHNSSYLGIVILSVIFFIGLSLFFDEKSSYLSSIASTAGMVPMISVLIVVGLAQSDYNAGTLKNVVTAGISRTSIYFGKLIAAFLGSMLVFFLEAIIITAFAIYNKQVLSFDLLFFLKSFGLQSLVMLNYTVIFFLIGSIIKSPAFAVCISFVIFAFGGALFGLVGSYLHISAITSYELGVASMAVEKVNVNTFALEHFAVITAIIIFVGIIGSLLYKNQEVK